MEITQFAPVLIPTLNRYAHFKRCVESLAKCTHAEKTDLFIALDYPLHDGHRDGYEEIKEHLPKINGFKSVIIIKRDRNFGAVDNFLESLDEVFEKYDRVIISEDDNVFSIDFLAFVNKGLEVYEKRSDIFSISGYQYPIKVPQSYKDDVYIWTGYSAWGVGIWKEKWNKVDWGYHELKNFLDDKRNIKKIKSIADNYVEALKNILKTGYITGDTLISYHLIIHGLYSIFPIVSRVRNMGHDGSGVHCGYLEKDIYSAQVLNLNNSDTNFPINIAKSSKMYKRLKAHFRYSLWVKTKRKIKNILSNVIIRYYPKKCVK